MECQNAGLGNMEFDYLTKFNNNDLRSFGSREVACEPDSRRGTVSELIKYPVPLTIDVSDVHWVIPSRSISIRTL